MELKEYWKRLAALHANTGTSIWISSKMRVHVRTLVER